MQVEQDWWRPFFEGPFGDLQVAGFDPQTTLEDVDRVEKRLGRPNLAILDAPCGAGRHALEFARRGHRVVGVDFNDKVLQAARAAAQSQGLAVDLRKQDLRTLDFDCAFDCVTCLWSSIGYFSDEDNDRVFAGLARALRPGGVLVFELLATETLFPRFGERGWRWFGEGDARVRVCEERFWDPIRGRIDCEWTFIRQGQESAYSTTMRIYSCAELVKKLRDLGLSGFRAVDPLGGAFTVGSSRLWLEAEKAA